MKWTMFALLVVAGSSTLQAEDRYYFRDNGWKVTSRYGETHEDRGFTAEGTGLEAPKARTDARQRLKDSARDHAIAVTRIGEGGHDPLPPIYLAPVIVRPRVYYPVAPITVYRPVYVWP